MAGFLKNIASGITDMVSVAQARISPFTVQATSVDKLKGCPVTRQDGCLSLYRRLSTFDCVIHKPDVPSRMCSVFRQTSEEEANITFKLLASVMVPIVKSGAVTFEEDILQKILDCVRDHPSWTSAHVSAHQGFYACLKYPDIKENIDVQCTTHHMTPLMAAIIGKQALSVEELLRLGASLSKSDRNGDSPYHFAVLNCPPVVALLIDFDKQGVINSLNSKGQSALFLACQRKLFEATEMLISAGADPRIAASDCLPIHAAVQSGDLRSVEVIVKRFPEQANAQDFKNGGTLLHFADDSSTLQTLALLGCKVDVTNYEGNTPLHVMMEKKKSDCLMTLLCHGANCNVLDAQGESVLHKAIQQDNLDLVRQFVVFGADVNQPSSTGIKPRHMATVNRGKNKDTILYLLHVSGATRCSVSMKGCLAGCSAEENWNGTPDQTMSALMKLDNVAIFDEQLSSMAVDSASSPQRQGSVIDMVDTPFCTGDRVLCLDGGGIRGLILIQILMELEATVGKPIHECFDWIGGTSTGGILALGLARGFSLAYMKGLYVRLKDEVFKGKRPYDTGPFEEMLKREFGEEAVMSDIEHPKVLVTAVLADRFPAELVFFQNYERTLSHPVSSPSKVTYTAKSPSEQKVWEAARSSGAAPTYFRGFGAFLDGGLISNNPTLDVLTEIHEYNLGLKMLGRGDESRPIGCVISLGCGRSPCTDVKNLDVFIPTGLTDVRKVLYGVSSLGRLLVDQATISEGRPVDRARAWCSMINVPFYRFSPLLSENIGLDCHDNQVLINMLWETHCYMVANQHRLQELSTLLQPRDSQGAQCSRLRTSHNSF